MKVTITNNLRVTLDEMPFNSLFTFNNERVRKLQVAGRLLSYFSYTSERDVLLASESGRVFAVNAKRTVDAPTPYMLYRELITGQTFLFNNDLYFKAEKVTVNLADGNAAIFGTETKVVAVSAEVMVTV